MSDAAETPPEPPAADVPAAPEAPAAPAPVTSRLDPTDFLYDWQRLATFVERCRAAGLKTFEHPTGLRFSFEQTPKMPIRPTEGW